MSTILTVYLKEVVDNLRDRRTLMSALLMGDLDNLDDRISQLEGKLSDALESEGLGSRKVKKLKKELTEARAELSDLREQAVQLAKLPLKEPKKKA